MKGKTEVLRNDQGRDFGAKGAEPQRELLAKKFLVIYTLHHNKQTTMFIFYTASSQRRDSIATAL